MEITKSATYGNFRNYQIFQSNEASRAITFKISEFSMISFFRNLNIAEIMLDFKYPHKLTMYEQKL